MGATRSQDGMSSTLASFGRGHWIGMCRCAARSSRGTERTASRNVDARALLAGVYSADAGYTPGIVSKSNV